MHTHRYLEKNKQQQQKQKKFYIKNKKCKRNPLKPVSLKQIFSNKK